MGEDKKVILQFLNMTVNGIIEKVVQEDTTNLMLHRNGRDFILKFVANGEPISVKIEYPKIRKLNMVDAKKKVIELKAKGMSQSAIATEVGLSQKTISNYLKDEKKDK